MTCSAIHVPDLHEESSNESFTDIGVQFLLILETDEVNVESLHCAFQLFSDVLCLLECTEREIIRPSPIFVMFICGPACEKPLGW